jgi:hypothetical protein
MTGLNEGHQEQVGLREEFTLLKEHLQEQQKKWNQLHAKQLKQQHRLQRQVILLPRAHSARECGNSFGFRRVTARGMGRCMLANVHAHSFLAANVHAHSFLAAFCFVRH